VTSRRRALLLRIAFWATAVFAFVMAIVPHPPQLPDAPSDKVQHVAAFLVLGLLAFLAYSRTRPFLLGLGLSLFGALIEIIQAIPTLHRDSDPVDWLADTVAVALALIFLQWLRARRNGSVAEQR
jgi:VanZ family protein